MKALYGITVGGSANSLLRGQLAWLRARGWEIVLVTNRDERAKKAAHREQVTLREIPMRRNMSPLRDLTALARWVRTLRIEAPDVVNASTPKAGLLGMVASWIMRVPRRVYVVRGLRLEGAEGLGALVLWVVEWLTMRAATDIVFVSRSLAEATFARGLGRRSRAWLIGAGSSNGVDAASIARRAQESDGVAIRRQLGVAPEAFVAGFIGRVTSDKGADTIAEAAVDPTLDPRWHFLVVGSVEDEGIAARLDGASSVTRLDSMDAVWSLLSAMDVLVLPTRREGFPNVVLEAASARTPAITTRATGAVDSIVDGETGLLFPFGDVGALVAILDDLAGDPDRMETMGRAAEARAFRDFVPEDIWEGVHQIMSGNVTSSRVSRLDRPLTAAPIGDHR
ncbi:glycosyltransferase [Brachybacterium vulturis]|uniref:glycosyltransferase n=1 Tax=Brachybacterium vulturis TaxID=2017484 RepID=UPI001560216F|nr:glycosyltransferase [Brachybacterium vulturis]